MRLILVVIAAGALGACSETGLSSAKGDKGDTGTAQSAFSQAVKINPGNPDAQNGMAEVAMRNNDPSLLSATADQMIQGHPEVAQGYLWRGMAETRPALLNGITYKTLTPPAGRKDALIFDAEVKALALRVFASGTGKWIVQYRPTSVLGSREQAPPKRIAIGDRSRMSLSEARKAARGVLAGHSLVVPNREAGEECLEALLQRQLVIARVTREAALLDLDALVDYLVDQIGVLVAEERAHRVEARVHQRVEEVVPRAAPLG